MNLKFSLVKIREAKLLKEFFKFFVFLNHPTHSKIVPELYVYGITIVVTSVP